MSEILLPRFLHILIFDNCRFGGSFPAQRVKTAISFFTTFAISFPVGSLGEEFGWRGVMAPYITLLLDRRFGAGRTWKWTPLLQSLLTGIVWAVRGFLSCCIVFFAVAAV
jgi:membrane protease YdiL (CAAX protease family)